MSQLWKIDGSELLRIEYQPLPREDQLEDWIAKDPTILGLELLIIGRQLPKFRGRLDLLGMDRDGGLVIIELKRDKTPRDVVAQVLEYASWIKDLTTKDVHDLSKDYLKGTLQEAFRERFDASLPETLNSTHSMLIVASELDETSKRIVEYLAEVHGVNINTAFFRSFADSQGRYLVADWLMDQEQVVERAEEKSKAPWTGYYFVNIGYDPNVRDWDDMQRFGFVAAGYGKKYSGELFTLQIGDPIFAYQKKSGYVGYGIVTSTPVIAESFLTSDGRPLIEQDLKVKNIFHTPDDPELVDYLVGVDWKKTYSFNEAKRIDGGFANQHIVCKLRHPATLDYLMKVFEVRPDK